MSEHVRERDHCIVLVGFTQDVADMLQGMLEDEGYQTRIAALGPQVLDEVVEAAPSVAVVALGPSGENLALIDRLRATEATAGLPVLAMGTLPAQREQAQASGNVAAVLPMPFDLDELLEAVRAVLSHTPFEARVQRLPPEGDRARAHAADILARAERDLMLGWLQRVRTVEPYASRSELSTSEFLDNLPRLLNALILLLRHQQPPGILERDDDARERIRTHARLRADQGLRADAVVREYQVLREIVGDRLRRDLPAEDVLEPLSELDALLDEAVRITVADFGSSEPGDHGRS